MSGQREWSSGMCDCFSPCSSCMLAWCCPCILYGKTANRISRRDAHLTNSDYSSCNGDCALYCGLAALTGGIGPLIMTILQRGNVRDLSRESGATLTGGGCGDCCRAWCCHPCTLVQDDKEAEHLLSEYDGKSRVGGVGVQPGYGQQQGMQYGTAPGPRKAQ